MVALDIEAESAIVDCMESTLNAWRWPKNKDVLHKFEDMVMGIDHSKLIKIGLFPLTGL